MKNLFKKTLILISFLASALVSEAHFGSKGPFGGHVATSFNWKDSLLIIGTNEGGVYFSSNPNIVGWQARVVGLKSGKITAVTHTGSYAFAATADSGIFIFDGRIGNDRYWNKVNNGLTNLNVTSLLAIDSITVLAGTDGGGVFKTTDKGKNWVAVNNHSLHHLDISKLVNVGNKVVSLSVDGGVWYTDNLGVSWKELNDENTAHIAGSTEINYNATTDELLVLNQLGLYKASSASTSDSATVTYSLVSTGLPANVKIFDLANDGANWYIASDSGIYSSPANAIAWTKISGTFTKDAFTTINPFRALLVAGTANDGIAKNAKSPVKWAWVNTNFNNLKTTAFHSQARLIVAGTEKGLFVSKDLATNYARGNKGLTDSLNVTDIAQAGNYLFATTKNAGVFVSDTTGVLNWTAINTGLTNLGINKIFVLNNQLFIIDNANKVFNANPAAPVWADFSNGLPNNTPVSSLTASSDAYYVSTNGGNGDGVYKKLFTESLWSPITTGLSTTKITSLAVNGNTLFAGTEDKSLLKTDLTTINWTSVDTLVRIPHTNTMGLSSTTIQALYVGYGYLWASYRGGLLASSNNGKSWIQGGNQFNLPSFADVNKIAFGFSTTLSANGRVFVYTPNNALYSNALSELPTVLTSLEENIVDAAQFGLYPNPSNNQFSFGGDAAADIEAIKVYDIQGNEVFSSAPKAVYSHQLASGIYFVKVATAKGVAFVKLAVE